MPLPKPSKSKTVSRRIKKPKPPLFTSALQPEKIPPIKPTKQPRERRVRVICTDPDATDSSSDEEGERAPTQPRYTLKRFVCEIALPASPPIFFNEVPQEETSVGPACSSSNCIAFEERKKFKIARKEVGLESLYGRTDEPASYPLAENLSECLSSDHLSAGMPVDDPSIVLSVNNLRGCPPADNLSLGMPAVNLSGCLLADNQRAEISTGCLPPEDLSACLPADNPSVDLMADNLSGSLAAEELGQFFDKFFSEEDDSSIPTWDTGMDLLDGNIFNNPLDFELDFESSAWINSVQEV